MISKNSKIGEEMASSSNPSSSQMTKPEAEPSASKRAYDDVWRQIDALGGTHTREDRESGYGEAYDRALTTALAAPDLLTSLKDAVETLVDLSRARWSELECTEDELVGAYRAAISKAENRP